MMTQRQMPIVVDASRRGRLCTASTLQKSLPFPYQFALMPSWLTRASTLQGSRHSSASVMSGWTPQPDLHVRLWWHRDKCHSRL